MLKQSALENFDDSLLSPSHMQVVFNKADLIENEEENQQNLFLWETLTKTSDIKPEIISCLSGLGLGTLEAGITTNIKNMLQSSKYNENQSEGVMITRERHRRHVRQCVDHLNSFLYDGLPMDLAAEEIRLAMQELGKVTGRVDVEELLDIIFRDFCIGK